MPRPPLAPVRSSDLVDWEFCAVKFYLERVLHRTPARARMRDAARSAGTARHEEHDAGLAEASRIGRFASAVSIAGIAALLLMLLLGLAGCAPATREDVRGWAGALGAGLVVIALLLHRAAAGLRRRSGIPRHLRMLSSDAGVERGPLLRDDRLGLVGQPDYLFTRRHGFRKLVHAAEFKSRPAPSRRPFRGHVLQTAASIHLARKHYGRRASTTGYLAYTDASIPVELTRPLADELAEAVRTVRSVMTASTPPDRNHSSPRRCAACPFVDECPMSLGSSSIPAQS